MARGYDASEIKSRLIKLLHDSKTGISGTEISQRLGINRITITKYLNIFSAEGIISEKSIGNVNLWFVQEGTEQLKFPDDYFRVSDKYIEYLTKCSESAINNLIRNCLNSEVNAIRLMTEVIQPAASQIQKKFDDGKIGKIEEQLMKNILLKSIQIINFHSQNLENEKNTIIISSDNQSLLDAQIASAAYHSQGWNTFFVGDLSLSMDILFDLELTKLLSKIWKLKQGLMIVVVFSKTDESLKFFSDSFYSVKGKNDENLHLILSGKIGKKTTIKSDLQTEKLEDMLQWSQTKFENI